MAEKIWSDDAWDSYLLWQMEDKKTVKKINDLIKDIERNGVSSGKGKPEILTGNLSGYFSRRINDKDRLIYKIVNNKIYIAQCKGHYNDK